MRDDAGLMTRRATVFARAEVTRIVNEPQDDWHSRAAREALLSFMAWKMVCNQTPAMDRQRLVPMRCRRPFTVRNVTHAPVSH